MSTLKELKKAIGRRIVRIEYPRYYDEYARNWLHDPVIVLDDGTRLYFGVEEGSAEHGVYMGINRKDQSPTGESK